MVHNGIEYADMQLIAEAYDLLKTIFGMSADEIGDVFANWKTGELDSYLIEITAAVLRKRDAGGGALVDQIVDEAEQKGTGRWAAQSALELGVPVTAITEAVYARAVSARRGQRALAERRFPHPPSDIRKATAAEIDAVRDALYASKIVAYAQGFEQMTVASAQYGWDLKLGEIATIWRGGCIIRARFLDRIMEAYANDPQLPESDPRRLFSRLDRQMRGRLATYCRIGGDPRRRGSRLLLGPGLLRRFSARPRAGQSAAGSARLFRRAHVSAARQARQLPYALEPGPNRSRGVIPKPFRADAAPAPASRASARRVDVRQARNGRCWRGGNQRAGRSFRSPLVEC